MSTEVHNTSFKIKTMDMDGGTVNKSQRLVRSSSLEKIRRFNSYICSQQFYLLPALLTSLKSQSFGLHAAAERTIYIFRSLFLNAILYKCLKCQAKLHSVVSLQFNRLIESKMALKVIITIVCLTLFSQTALAMYLLMSTYIPGGLIFLVICMFYITYLNFRINLFVLQQEKINFIKKSH